MAELRKVKAPVLWVIAMTRYADGYLRLLADWAKGERHPPYGAMILP